MSMYLYLNHNIKLRVKLKFLIIGGVVYLQNQTALLHKNSYHLIFSQNYKLIQCIIHTPTLNPSALGHNELLRMSHFSFMYRSL